MRDLVETVIGQVMHKEPAFTTPVRKATPLRMPQDGPTVHQLGSAAQVSAAHTPSENDPLWKASRKFESLFIEQMLAEMRKTVPKSGLLNKGFAEGVQTTMLDQAIADAISKQGRMGIASSLYRQLSNHYANPAGAVTPQVGAANGDKQITATPTGSEQGGTHGSN